MLIWIILYGPADTRSGGFLYDRKLIDFLKQDGNEIVIILQREGALFRKLWGNIHLFKLTKGLRRPDLIIEDELNHPSLFLSGGRGSMKNIPRVSIVHHLRSLERLSGFDRMITEIMEKVYLRRIDGFIFNSRNTAESVGNLLPDLSTRPSIIAYPGRDALPVKPGTAQNEGLRILFTGNLIRRKNLHLLLEALVPLSSFRWTLDICGETGIDPPYMDELRAFISSHGWASRVFFHGRVSDEELTEFMEHSDLLAVPSSWEGFGIVYLEAMSAGCIPLAGKRGGTSEIIKDHENGFLVNPDPDSIHTIIREVLESPELKTSLRQNAILRALEFPTWRKTMTGIRDFLWRWKK